MHLRLKRKISVSSAAKLLRAKLPGTEIELDYENQYEWAYVDLAGLSFTLDITRDHGMSEIDDEFLGKVSDAEIESLDTAGPTYLFGIDRKTDSIVDDVPSWAIQNICDALQTEIDILPGRLNVAGEDPPSTLTVKPSYN